MEERKEDLNKIPFEVALDKVGFGMYSYINTLCSGMAIIGMASMAYSATMIVPVSACELETTGAQQGIVMSLPVIGLILGATVWGYLGDTRGRRKMLLVALLSSAFVNAVGSLSVNWIMLMIVQLLCAILAAANYTLSMTLLSECVPQSKRNLVVLLVASIFMLSQGLMAVIAIPVIPLTFSHYLPALGIYWNSWRTMMLIYSLPSLICACLLYFLQESPKFALAKGDEQRALEILRKIQRVNLGKKAVFDIQGLLPETTQQTSQLSAKDQIVPLFRAPLLKYTVILTLLFMFQLSGSFSVWLPTIANRVIQMYETGEVEHMTLCGILHADIDAPVDPDIAPCALNVMSLVILIVIGAFQAILNLFLTLVVVNRAGRRNTVMALTAIAGLAGVLVNLVPNTIGTSILFILFITGIMAVGLYTAIAVAIFPTHLRAIAVAMTMTAGRICSIAGIQLANFLLENNCELGLYLFGAIFASSAIVASFLPDDRFLQKPQPPKEKEEEES